MSTTTLEASAIKTKFIEELVEIYNTRAVLPKLAGKYTEEVEIGNDTVRFNRLLRTAKATSALSEGQTSFTDSTFTSNKVEVSIAEWGHTWYVTKRTDLVSIIKNKARRANLMDHVISTTEYQIMKVIATGGLRHRIDYDTTYEVYGTADSGSTTTLVDDALTQADDAWNGGRATITNATGANYDITSAVTDFVASSDTATVSFPQAIGSSSKYALVVGTGILATDVLTLTGLLHVAALHEHLHTPKFDDGMYRMLLDSAQKKDLWAADAIQKYIYYDRSELIGKNSLPRLLDIEFIVSDETYREDVDGTENQSTGIVRIAPLLGKDTFQIEHWGSGTGPFGLELKMVDTPDSGNKLGMKRWLGWYAPFAGIVTRATADICLMTGATDLGVLR